MTVLDCSQVRVAASLKTGQVRSGFCQLFLHITFKFWSDFRENLTFLQMPDSNHGSGPFFLGSFTKFEWQILQKGNEQRKGFDSLNCVFSMYSMHKQTLKSKCLHQHTRTHTPPHHSFTLCPSQSLFHFFPALEITSKSTGSLEERRSRIQLQPSSWEGPTGGANTPPPVT